jgi:hypothetical protein
MPDSLHQQARKLVLEGKHAGSINELILPRFPLISKHSTGK